MGQRCGSSWYSCLVPKSSFPRQVLALVVTAFSLLKRGIMGSWHKISAKHLPAYLDEMTFRFNRRKSPYLFQDTLRHMVTADPLTFERLIA